MSLVCGIYVMAALACSALAGAAWRAANGTRAKLWVTAVLSVIVTQVLYRRLLNSVEGWASLVRALVNKTRDPLCEKYRLLLHDMILPVLNGLDEIPQTARARILASMTFGGTVRPLVVTCRTGEFVAIARAGLRFPGAAVVQL